MRYAEPYIRFAGVLAIALASMAAVSLPASDCFAAASDMVVAVVNGHKLRQVHFERVMSQILPMASYHGGISEEVKKRNMGKAIERLVDDELLYQEGISMGLKPDAKAVNKELDEAIERVGGEARFNEALVHYGIDREEFKRMLGKPAVVDMVLEAKVESAAKVSQREIKKYYEENKAAHFMVERRRFRHIVFKTDPGAPDTWDSVEKIAKDTLEKIRAGEDFAELARKMSEGPRKEKGGDTGYVNKSQLLPELAREGWKMKPGQVSGLIRTIYGFHILKLEDAPPAEAIPFEEAKERIYDFLLEARKKAIKDELIKSLRDRAEIEVFVE